MNNKILSLLGVAVATTGMTVGATSTQASTLGPGTVSVQLDQGVFFSNNIADFILDGTSVPNPGVAGDGSVSTPANPLDPDAEIYGIVPGNAATYPAFDNIGEILGKLAGRSFVGAPIKFNDIIFVQDPTDPDSPGIFVNNGQTYDLTGGGAIDGFTFAEFDTDGDTGFGDSAGDFSYIATSFTRVVEPGATGGFNIIFDLEGFFRDGSGNFKDTPSNFALFNGAAGVNPQTLPVLTLNEFVAGVGTPDVRFIASADGVINTSGREAPEPGTIIGLTAVAGLGLAGRLKRKAK
ncbi:hypothetical protein cce_0649 [Crocosphaera subtropica ATCC 51142]|uniref:PEP-CTERM protein-sorting domain-containing protein n=1 Tax=Crocosphaera subtropica (strain ATCC 51142 / BH68) TaxID=43989 RepID=B1WQ78_CROS5|nr:PEP-CTERM sorting domain-containing protein [Crocosphaera subtropica]ACB50000.1 hypothetical protein cce_0649 [Crocosphaera subtropica ATCC 51142]